MSGADFVIARDPEDVAAEKRGLALRYCQNLVGAAVQVVANPESIEAWVGYSLLRGMQNARQCIELVARKDLFERERLKRLKRQYGPTAPDEIKSEAQLKLCASAAPLLGDLGVLLNPWFTDPVNSYELAKTTLNTTRINWANDRKRWRKRMRSLCGALVQDGKIVETQEDAYSGESKGEGAGPSGDAPDTEGMPTAAAAHLFDLLGKLSSYLHSLPPEERPIAEMLSTGHSVADVTAVKLGSKRKVQAMRKRLEEALAEFRPAPSKRKPYKKIKIPKPGPKKRTEMDEAVAQFKAMGKKYGLVNYSSFPPVDDKLMAAVYSYHPNWGRDCCNGKCWKCVYFDGFKRPEGYRPSKLVTDPEMIAVIAAIDERKVDIAKRGHSDSGRPSREPADVPVSSWGDPPKEAKLSPAGLAEQLTAVSS